MARQQKQRNHGKGKTILRVPDLEQSRSAVLNALAAASSQESNGMQLTNSRAGIARNRALRSTGRSCSGTASFSSRNSSLPQLSRSGLRLSGGSRTKRRTLASSVPNSPPASDGSRVPSALANVWVTGFLRSGSFTRTTRWRGRSVFAQQAGSGYHCPSAWVWFASSGIGRIARGGCATSGGPLDHRRSCWKG
jgi:hypothetical protein